ncbi:MAG: putative porin [Alphaproteobacteria bacterium]|nr:putative porin [Alphaproteobacteria bacterium]
MKPARWTLLLASLALPWVASAQEAPPKDGVMPPEMAKPKMQVQMPHLGGLKPFADVTLRYDNIWTTDPNDVFRVPREEVEVRDNATIPGAGEYIDGFRTKVRFGVKTTDEDALLGGGIRVAVGQNPNPASSFVPLGNVFRPTGIGIDQYWMSIQPLIKLDAPVTLRLDAGKMPNPFWRGEVKGTAFATEMIWDNDVNPAGVAGTLGIPVNDSVTIENALAYWVLEDLEDRRFVGLTGEVNIIADQVRVKTPYVTAALTYTGFENINSGLHAPGVTGPGNATIDPGSTAFLLGRGLQNGNNHVNYGPGAEGFRVGHFRTLSLAGQFHHTVELDAMDITPHFMIDTVVNTSVKNDRVGVAVTAGSIIGGWDDASKVNPFDVWLTYRDVRGDATIAAIADSDLGRGTQYAGLEAVVGYSFAKNLKLAVNYFEFDRFPRRANHDRRIFFDLIGKL